MLYCKRINERVYIIKCRARQIRKMCCTSVLIYTPYMMMIRALINTSKHFSKFVLNFPKFLEI